MAAVALALAVYGTIACGSGGGDDGSDAPDCATSTLRYETFAKPLFTQHCAECHGAGSAELRLDTVNAIRAQSHEIIERAVDRTATPTMPFEMPALPEQQREDLRTWLECGAPP
jgi:mono/diheme cytochrome c family protein